MRKRVRVNASPVFPAGNALSPDDLLDGWTLTVQHPAGRRAFRFIRPDAAGELLREHEGVLARRLKIPSEYDVMRVRGSRTLGEAGIWSIKFEPISSCELYSLPRV